MNQASVIAFGLLGIVTSGIKKNAILLPYIDIWKIIPYLQADS